MIPRVTVLGTSPRFLSEIQGRGIDPRRCVLVTNHGGITQLWVHSAVKLGTFTSLRVIFCTGAVLTPPMFEWTQKAFGNKLHLISTSGGTDICSSCMLRDDYPIVDLLT